MEFLNFQKEIIQSFFHYHVFCVLTKTYSDAEPDELFEVAAKAVSEKRAKGAPTVFERLRKNNPHDSAQQLIDKFNSRTASRRERDRASKASKRLGPSATICKKQATGRRTVFESLRRAHSDATAEEILDIYEESQALRLAKDRASTAYKRARQGKATEDQAGQIVRRVSGSPVTSSNTLLASNEALAPSSLECAATRTLQDANAQNTDVDQPYFGPDATLTLFCFHFANEAVVRQPEGRDLILDFQHNIKQIENDCEPSSSCTPGAVSASTCTQTDESMYREEHQHPSQNARTGRAPPGQLWDHEISEFSTWCASVPDHERASLLIAVNQLEPASGNDNLTDAEFNALDDETSEDYDLMG
ncbi:hypothetical protein FVE85_8667 [Porphyridium purpureum]|uniref:Uncharacterized protein n=1 Tax=Porphyridium purpureum TaxID=35688 RepID=A0A5J4YR03_PORPP|nr:hypothetical protein FVE85_8667 [Porphyridium purpureum]|eukprot:POR0865..scf296_7